MEELYRADIQAPATISTASIKMNSMNPENLDSYEVSVPRAERFLLSLFKKFNIQKSPEEPVRDITSFTQEVITKGSGSFYVPKDNINSAISHYRHNAPAPNKLPDKNKPLEEPINFFVTESISLPTMVCLNDRVLKKGTKIEFFYEGHIDE
jgi:hypothetical protein